MSKYRLMTALAAGLVAGFAQFAGAAELDLRYHPKAERPFSWSTCYGGIHVGVGTTHDTWTADPFLDGVGSLSYWGFGVLGGVQGGCNYQVGHFVVGLESEFWGSSLKSENNFTSFGDSERLTASNPWTFATSIRAGLAIDQSFIYLKGGFAYGAFHYNFTSFDAAAAGSAVNGGMLAGVGFEHAITREWSGKVEVNAIMFSAFNVNIAGDDIPGPDARRQSISATQVIFKVGVNRLFNIDTEIRY
jgi:outer membrane immunogenic protein